MAVRLLAEAVRVLKEAAIRIVETVIVPPECLETVLWKLNQRWVEVLRMPIKAMKMDCERARRCREATSRGKLSL